MNILSIIEKKKAGQKLSPSEIHFFVNGAANGSIPDYQLSALLMAICLKGMDEEETYQLTLAIKNSGEVLDLSFAGSLTVDKHSTGGVSDTVTPVLIAVLACNGLITVKMSGRGLSHTGGTIDKLEGIKGFNTTLSKEQIINAVKECGAAITAQTANLAPADKVLYALRDVTATVDSIPLIASSIMSKKLAAGTDIIMLDVKYGSGAFMKTAEQALKLAQSMVNIAIRDKKKCAALVTSMEQPLTGYIGCNMEINSAIAVLKGEKDRLYTVTKELCANIFTLAKKTENINEAYKLFDTAISSGNALQKFKQIIKCQGGDTSFIENGLQYASNKKEIFAQKGGYISHINAAGIGKAVLKLGGGRERKDDIIDHGAGIKLFINLNDKINKGDLIAELYTSDKKRFTEAEEIINGCYTLSDNIADQNKLLYALVTGQGTKNI